MLDNEAQLKSLLQTACEMESPQRRSEFLDKSCVGKPGLRERLQAIMDALPEASDEAQPASVAKMPVKHASSEQSVLKTLGHNVRAPSVVLDDSLAPGDEPILQPASKEMPKTVESSRYQLQGEIARGGMGAVLKGRDIDLGRNLAIKVLLDEHRENPQVIQRFVEEAQIGGQLQHPGVAPVYELGQFEDKRPFFTMKLVKGETLAYMLAGRRAVTQNRAKLLGIFEQVCQTMAYAHSRRVIHRDLKPANIMVGAFGEVQVMDWGLAKVLPKGGQQSAPKTLPPDDGKSVIATFRSGGSDLPSPKIGSLNPIGSDTQMGSAMGTPAYMPPEQALGEVDRMDRRSDVFGLGAILCEILTGQPPYVADDTPSLLRLACRGNTNSCQQRLEQSRADKQLIQLTMRCLEFELSDRPKDASEVAQEMTTYLRSVETQLRETEIRKAEEAAKTVEERKRLRVVIALAASILLTLGLGGVGWTWNRQQLAQRRQAAQQEFEQGLNDARLHKSLAENPNLALRKSELELAIKSTQSAIKLADQLDLPGDMVRPARELQQSAQEDLKQTTKAITTQDRDRRLKEQLDLIRVRGIAIGEQNQADEVDAVHRGEHYQRIEAGYRETFAAAGILLAEQTDAQIAARIRASSLRGEFVAALDHWISVIPGVREETLVDAHLSVGDWKQAAERARLVWQNDPKNTKHWLRLAPALVLADQHNEYRQLCKAMCDQFVTSRAMQDSSRTTKVCLLVPDAIEISEVPSAMLESALDEGNVPAGWYWASRSLLEYRRGKPREAYKWILGVEAAGPGPLAGAYVQALKCLIETELGKREQAIASLHKAGELLTEILESPVHRSSLDAAFALIHFREAEEKLRVESPSSARIHQFVASGLSASEAPLSLQMYQHKQRLGRLVEKADDDRFRQDVRNAVATEDTERLIALASTEDAQKHSRAFTSWLGAVLRREYQVDSAIQVLRSAQITSPADTQLNLELSQCFQWIEKPSEALSYARAAHSARPASYATQWMLMTTLADADRIEESRRLFAQILSASDLHAEGLVDLASGLNSSDYPAHAKLALDKALQLDDKNVAVYRELCRTHRKLNDAEAALAAGEKALRLSPDDFKTHWELGGVYHYVLKEYAAAVVSYSRAAELEPRSAPIAYQLAYSLKRAGRDDESIATLRQCLLLDPNHLTARRVLSQLLAAKMRTDARDSGVAGQAKAFDQLSNHASNSEFTVTASVQEMLSRLKNQPKDARSRNILIAALLQLHRYKEAEKHVKILLQFDPENATGLISGGILRMRQERPDLAATFFEKAASVAAPEKKEKAAAYVQLGIALEEQIKSGDSHALSETDRGLLDRAVAAYRTAYDLAPKHRRARRALIGALERGGYYDEADVRIELFESLESQEIIQQLMREASWLWNDKQWEESIAVSKEILQRDPNQQGALVYLLQGYLTLGKYSESLKYAERMAELLPGSHHALRAVGELQLRTGQYEKGLVTLREVLDKRPTDSLVRGDIASGLYELGRRNEAIEECRAGLEADPQDSVMRALLALFIVLPSEMQGKTEELQEAYQLAQIAFKSTRNTTRENRAQAFAETLGIVLYRLDRFEEAAQVLSNVDTDQTFVTADVYLAMAYHQLGDQAKARAIYQRCLTSSAKLERLLPSQEAMLREANKLLKVE
ncbi:MAG TPA: hypothetical protein DDW52_19415 [Planctomycetaceae bacterium]|nr:hypothetical protein [Planctomycetaceae bacterium]